MLLPSGVWSAAEAWAARRPTSSAVKPSSGMNCVARRLLGRVLARFEDKGLNLIAMKLMEVTPELARKHYAEHVQKAWYPGLEAFVTQSPLVAAIVEGPEAIRVVRDMVGHGVGVDMHEPPEIPNFGRPGTGPRIKPGMTLAIEPMVNLGDYKTKTLGDGWTVVTADGSPSAHFEHTVLTTGRGPEILTIPRPVKPPAPLPGPAQPS